jgi:tripartite-type tricarboxylate transporter receptor subunit TctC
MKTLTPWIAALALAVPLAGGPADAADIACRTARLIVPSNAGGSTDGVMRPYVDAVNRLGAEPNLQVVNIGGQATVKGAREARDADPDGCTLNVAHESLMLTYLSGQNDFTYDAFETVAVLTFDPLVLTASADAPFDDLDGLIEHAGAHPGEVLAGASIGGTSHFSLLMLVQQTGIDLRYVSYNGARERVTALLANNIQLSDADVGTAVQYGASGEIVPIAVLAEERLELLPEVPTARELGVDVQFGLTHALFMPKGTPQEIVDHYADLFEQAAADEALRENLAQRGTQIAFKRGDAAREVLDGNFAKMKGIADELGVFQPAN